MNPENCVSKRRTPLIIHPNKYSLSFSQFSNASLAPCQKFQYSHQLSPPPSHQALASPNRHTSSLEDTQLPGNIDVRILLHPPRPLQTRHSIPPTRPRLLTIWTSLLRSGDLGAGTWNSWGRPGGCCESPVTPRVSSNVLRGGSGVCLLIGDQASFWPPRPRLASADRSASATGRRQAD